MTTVTTVTTDSQPDAEQKTDVAQERVQRKQALAAALRLFGKFGFSEGVAGHMTVRDPELPDHFWLNPFGVHFSQVKVSTLVLVDGEGNVVEGPAGVLNPAAFAIHASIHAARPDVVAAAHTHSLYGKAFSSLGRLLDPITQDACVFYGDLGLLDKYNGLVFSAEEGRRLTAALGPHKACILRNHGLLTVGRTVDECAWWFTTLERSCQAQLLAEAAGTPLLIDDDIARATAEVAGSPEAGYFSFQPMKSLILAEQPDLLD